MTKKCRFETVHSRSWPTFFSLFCRPESSSRLVQLRKVSMLPSLGMAYRPSTKLAAAFCTRCIRSKDHLMIS